MMLLDEMNFFVKLALLLLVLMIMSWVVWEIVKTPLTRVRKLKVAATGAVLLSTYLYFFLQGHSIAFNQEGIISAKLDNLKRAIPAGQHYVERQSQKAEKLLDNFIFIDTDLCIDLLPLGYEEDSTQVAITNRRALYRLAGFLGQHIDKVGAVAFDIVFPESTYDDQQLVDSLYTIAKKDKLILAYDKYLYRENPAFYKHYDARSLGDVQLRKEEPIYYAHSITAEDSEVNSFSYQLYAKTNRTNLEAEDSTYFVHRNFITEFYLFNNKPLLKRRFNLGDANTEDGRVKILRTIDSIHQEGKQPVFFIGNITNDQIDIHNTAYGLFNGALINLNEFLYFSFKDHLMNGWVLTGYLLFIFLCFFCILYYILTRAAQKDLRNVRPDASAKSATLSPLREWIESFGKFVLDEVYIVLILAMALLIDLIFDKLINIVGLLYFIPMFSALLKYFINGKNQRRLR